jgi:hypothetical protein
MTVEQRILASQEPTSVTLTRVGHAASVNVYRKDCRVWQYEWTLN